MWCRLRAAPGGTAILTAVHTGGRGIARWLLILSIAAGLIAMHHLGAHTPDMHGPDMSSPAMATAAPDQATEQPISMDAATRAAHPASGMELAAAAPDPGTTTMSMLMHLCLAVLAGLLVLGMLAVAFAILSRPPRAANVSRSVVIAWPRPPPRTAVRLAQLCVLRN
jgi:hypothetical protein